MSNISPWIFLLSDIPLTQTINLTLTITLTEQGKGKYPRGNCPGGAVRPPPLHGRHASRHNCRVVLSHLTADKPTRHVYKSGDDTIRHDTIRYIYVRSTADEMASLI